MYLIVELDEKNIQTNGTHSKNILYINFRVRVCSFFLILVRNTTVCKRVVLPRHRITQKRMRCFSYYVVYTGVVIVRNQYCIFAVSACRRLLLFFVSCCINDDFSLLLPLSPHICGSCLAENNNNNEG